MIFKFEQFIKELHTKFADKFSLEEIKQILDLKDNYDKDTPVSTGKQLIINRIEFAGIKATKEKQPYSNQVIDYSREIDTGINIWIADNLKGKSSIFKILKYAITGKNSLKENIKKWVKNIIIHFSINENKYTVYLDMKARLRAALLSGHLTDKENIENKIEEDGIFTANSETAYQEQIQDFFFKQFSYYPLKWTQKSPLKDSDELLEASASWSTYFKSILLESKDSNSLMYGDQGKKVFQMLLGLELTYPINQLSIKKDFLQNEKVKHYSSLGRIMKNDEKELKQLKSDLEKIKKKIIKYTENRKSKTDTNSLYEEYDSIIKKIEKENNKILEREEVLLRLGRDLNLVNGKLINNKSEMSRLEKEYDTTKRRQIDLTEYIEIGIFFSNLDIKHCPSCSNSISDVKKKEKQKAKHCPLCDEAVNVSNDDVDREHYEKKLENLTKILQQLELEMDILSKINEKEKKEFDNINKNFESEKKLKEKETNILLLNNKLKDLEDKINIEKEKVQPEEDEKENLIAEKAIIEYRIKELEKGDSNESINYDGHIDIIEHALLELKNTRYKLGEKVFKRLKKLMLNEVQELGLTSITEIEIDNNFNIRYKQDGDFISFDNIAEGEQLRAKIAFYLSLIQLDIEYNLGRHTRLLIIDSPGKEEGDANYLEGLATVLNGIETRFGGKLQILIATAERELTDVVKKQYITKKDTYIF